MKKWFSGVLWRLFDSLWHIATVIIFLIIGIVYAITGISMIWALYWLLSGRNMFHDEEKYITGFVTDKMDDVQNWQDCWKCHIQEMK